MSGLRRWLLRLAIVLASTLACLLGVEGYLRLRGVEPPIRPYSVGEKYTRKTDPPIRYELCPDAVAAWIYPSSGFSDERRIVARINALGFRGPDRERAKPEGVVRVVCLGDSMTFGVGVQDAETWPVVLRSALAAQRPAAAIEVWNCGVPGYDTVQQVAQFASRLRDTEPDVVIVAYYANDAKGTGLRLRTLGRVEQLVFDLTREDPGGLVGKLRGVSWLAELSAQRAARKLMESRHEGLWERFHSDESDGWTSVRRELRRLRDLCAELGAELLVVPYPQLQKEGEHLSTHGAYQQVFAFCAAESIAALDVEPLLEELDVQRMWAHPLDNHPGAATQAVFGSAVAGWLKDAGWLAPGGAAPK